MNLYFSFFVYYLEIQFFIYWIFFVYFFLYYLSIFCFFPILFQVLCFFIGLMRWLDCLYPFPACFWWILVSLVGVLVRLSLFSLLVALLDFYQGGGLFVAFVFLARRFCLFQNSCYLRIPRLASCFWCYSLFLDQFLSCWA